MKILDLAMEWRRDFLDFFFLANCTVFVSWSDELLDSEELDEPLEDSDDEWLSSTSVGSKTSDPFLLM